MYSPSHSNTLASSSVGSVAPNQAAATALKPCRPPSTEWQGQVRLPEVNDAYAPSLRLILDRNDFELGKGGPGVITAGQLELQHPSVMHSPERIAVVYHPSNDPIFVQLPPGVSNEGRQQGQGVVVIGQIQGNFIRASGVEFVPLNMLSQITSALTMCRSKCQSDPSSIPITSYYKPGVDSGPQARIPQSTSFANDSRPMAQGTKAAPDPFGQVAATGQAEGPEPTRTDIGDCGVEDEDYSKFFGF